MARTVFTTSRTLIRKLMDEDFPAFFEMQSDAQVMQWITGKAQTKEECTEDFDHCRNAYTQPHNDFWVWGVADRSDHQFLGTVAVVKNEDKEFEIGYRFLRKYWGNGLGQELANALIVHCLETMQLPEIVAYVDVCNLGSVKILEKSPMRFEWEKFIPETQITDRFYRLTR